MTDRDTFLRAIRADPDADTPRLVFADWLDDHGDPDWAELIRVQVELEPIHEELDHPRRQVLADRETELLARHGDRWLGPAKDIAAEYPAYGPVFRRGLPESVSLSLDTFLTRGGELFAACPTVREVCVYGVAGRGAELAACPHLSRVETLEIADWLPVGDDEPVFGLMAAVPAVRLWVSAAVRHWPPIDDDALVVVDSWSGQARRFPLDGEIGHGLTAGRLADGTAALAVTRSDTVTLVTFDRAGGVSNWLSERCRAPEWTAEMLDDRFGLTPATVRVREFNNHTGLELRLWPSNYVRDYLRGPFDRPAGVTDRWWADRGGVLKRWLHEGRFVIEWDGREFWLDATGTVVSS